jgi:CHAT domain-containing protein
VASLNPHATLLTGPSATRERLLRELPLHGNFHFSGHAVGNLTDPSASALLLYDDDLVTVRDISRLRLTRAGTAYLSACETAKSGITLIDETINIASACQLAGFQHVIATLWPIRDNIAARAAKHIWQALRETDADAALAVHQATLELRRLYPAKPSIWAAYIHAGPLWIQSKRRKIRHLAKSLILPIPL